MISPPSKKNDSNVDSNPNKHENGSESRENSEESDLLKNPFKDVYDSNEGIDLITVKTERTIKLNKVDFSNKEIENTDLTNVNSKKEVGINNKKMKSLSEFHLKKRKVGNADFQNSHLKPRNQTHENVSFGESKTKGISYLGKPESLPMDVKAQNDPFETEPDKNIKSLPDKST